MKELVIVLFIYRDHRRLNIDQHLGLISIQLRLFAGIHELQRHWFEA